MEKTLSEIIDLQNSLEILRKQYIKAKNFQKEYITTNAKQVKNKIKNKQKTMFEYYYEKADEFEKQVIDALF